MTRTEFTPHFRGINSFLLNPKVAAMVDDAGEKIATAAASYAPVVGGQEWKVAKPGTWVRDDKLHVAMRMEAGTTKSKHGNAPRHRVVIIVQHYIGKGREAGRRALKTARGAMASVAKTEREEGV